MGTKALAYLHRRGFTDGTLRQARVGYQPCDVHDAPERWGFDAEHKAIWVPRGITLPFILGGELWKVWVRRPTGDPKYVALAGSANALYGSDTLQPGQPTMLVEGAFDALAVHQAASDIIAAVATGTTSGRTLSSLARLALARPVMLAHDADPAGEEAASWWQRILPHARRWRPLAQDPGEMLQAGLDVRAWIQAGLTEGKRC